MVRKRAVLTVSTPEYGYFQPVSLCATETVIEPVHHVGVAGLTMSVQFARMRVTVDGSPRDYVLLWQPDAKAPLDDASLAYEAATARYPGAAIVHRCAMSTGHARVQLAEGGNARAAAAATATFMFNGTWDESYPILVDVDGVRIEVRMAHRVDRFYAHTTRAGRAPT